MKKKSDEKKSKIFSKWIKKNNCWITKIQANY